MKSIYEKECGFCKFQKIQGLDCRLEELNVRARRKREGINQTRTFFLLLFELYRMRGRVIYNDEPICRMLRL